MSKLNTPPYSLEAEQSVLGSMLIDNSKIDDICEHITADDFYLSQHRAYFNIFSTMHKNGKAVDLATVTEQLKHANSVEFDKRDHANLEYSYCIELAKNTPSSSNAPIYAKIVKSRSVLRKVIASAHGMLDLAYSKPDDVNQVLADCERLLSDATESSEVTKTDNSCAAILKETVDWLEKMSQLSADIIGKTSGIQALDEKFNGFKDGTVTIIAARPAMGKTTLGLQVMATEALAGGNPLIFSLEMPRHSLMLKMASWYASINSSVLQKPKNLQDQHWASLGNVLKAFRPTKLEIIDSGDMTVNQIRIEMRRYEKRHGKPSIVMVDYLQLIKGEGKPENRTQEISKISIGMTRLAKEFNCPIILLSQLSRGVEERSDKRPMNSDLRESGQIEQDAEDIIFIYRDEIYNEQTKFKGVAELILGKCRNGVVGTTNCLFEGQFSRFTQYGNQESLIEAKPKRSYADKFQ
jgi:replicative DNA helicase